MYDDYSCCRRYYYRTDAESLIDQYLTNPRYNSLSKDVQHPWFYEIYLLAQNDDDLVCSSFQVAVCIVLIQTQDCLCFPTALELVMLANAILFLLSQDYYLLITAVIFPDF